MITRGKKGFTLIEFMLAFAIIGLMTVAVTKLYTTGVKAWSYTQTKMRVSSEVKFIMTVMTKFLQAANGSSITISRLDANQPANSYISGVLTETIYITGTQAQCGGSGTSTFVTIGVQVPPVEMYQNNNRLVLRWPVPIAAAPYYTYKSMTLTTNLDTISFAFDNSIKSDAVIINAKLSKMLYGGNPPNVYVTFLKKMVVLKHMSSAGYYAN